MAFTIGIAADMIGREKLREPSTHAEDTKELAEEIVKRVWHQIPMSNVADVVDAVCPEHKDVYCFCQQGIIILLGRYNPHPTWQDTLRLHLESDGGVRLCGDYKVIFKSADSL